MSIAVFGGGATSSAAFATGEWLQAGHGGAVLAVAVSPDNALVASGSEDGTVKLWQPRDGRLVRTLAGAASPGAALAFSPDGAVLACGHQDGRVRLWRVATGVLDKTLEVRWTNSEIGENYTGNQGIIRCLAFAPDGARLACGGGDWSLRVWRLTDGLQLTNRVKQAGAILGLAYSRDGTRLALASEDKTVQTVNASTFATIRSSPHGSNVLAVVYSPDGDSMVSASLDNLIRVWRTPDGGLERTLSCPGVTSLSFAGDGTTLYAGAQSGAIRAWTARGEWPLLKTWQAHRQAVLCVAAATDGSFIASGGADHACSLWTSNDIPLRLNSPAGQTRLISITAHSPDGRLTATASHDGSLLLRQAGDGTVTTCLTGHMDFVNALVFSPDSTLLASGGGCLDSTVKLYGMPEGRLVRTLDAHTNGVAALAFARDGKLLASAGDRGENAIYCWRVHDGALMQSFPGHASGTAALAFSPDGNTLASGGNYADGSVILWDVAAGNRLHTIENAHIGGICAIAYHPQATQLVTVGRKDNLVQVWSVPEGMLLARLSLPQRGRGAAFSADGKWLAACGANRIQFWRTTDWQPALTITNELWRVSALVFSPNGGFLLFGREDGTAGRMRNPLASVPNLALSPPMIQQGIVRLSVENPQWSPFVQLQVSSDTEQWTTLTNLVSADALLEVDDDSVDSGNRFYRASTPE